MSTTTLTLAKVTPKIAKQAEVMLAGYSSSNAANPDRRFMLLCACLAIEAGAEAVEVTTYSDQYGNVRQSFVGDTSTYNLAHRCLSTGILRPYWGIIKPVALRGATWKGGTVTGTSNTMMPNLPVFYTAL